MITRQITVEEVIEVTECGEAIANYADDKPYPSRLLLKFVNGQPLHVVIAHNITINQYIVITCYIPDQTLWDADFKRKIK